MSRLLYLVGLITTYVSITQTKAIEILKPIRDSGDEVGLIFPSGSFYKGEQYRKIAQAIQEASSLRVWVALNENYVHRYAGLYPIPKAPADAVRDLKKAGMTSGNYVALVHGIESKYLLKSAENSELKAVILMGCYFERHAQFKDYRLPVLTLAAELDGVARISRMAEEFFKLREDMVDSFSNLYRNPVLLLHGVNHAQFASGKMPDYVEEYDLPSDVSEDDAHRMIGEYVNDFLTVTFSSSPFQVENAQRDLEKAFSTSMDKFQPFLDIKSLGVSGNFSKWTVLIQRYIAGEFAKQIQISNKNEESRAFYTDKPSITIGGDSITVNTKSHQHDTFVSAYFGKESPNGLDVKLKTKDAIWEALIALGNVTQGSGPQTSLRSEPATCKSLNEFALEVTLNHSSKDAQDRYKTRGRPIIFEEDTTTGNGIFWIIGSYQTSEALQNVHVKAYAYTSPITSSSNPGVLYCKLMSPYRIMEWINIDSLKKPFQGNAT